MGAGDPMDVDEAGPSANEIEQIKDAFRPPLFKMGGSSHSEILAMPAPKPAQQAINTPLKFAHPNLFAPIQSSAHPLPNSLVTEFSLSWADSEVLHDTGSIQDAPSKAEVLKRLREPEETQRASWERKRFKAAGGNLAAYNRGFWGARVGLNRL
ncbi:uncharacterized protein BDZ99DRAFT_467039 [Mytilinidion resinicola]|uniref:Uncharacterized protein n=1 Tax=Mytilinidion resinicola TaxID=574789 RepID=A0A6A6Y7X3_9PEZI|nr:uncharacterized protein BDZ99DRAFT_467039 [Mytilinidion resinicola]KAF2804780.1 hypothetical protein BDZ99DRAFT_467039 [Mytilinidion resinicola]